MDWYRGKKVYLTGGSSGIGKAAAQQLISYGADVYIGARGEARLKEVVAELEAGRINEAQIIGSVTVDVAHKASAMKAAEEVLEGLGGLDVLVNNAGIAHPAIAEKTPDEVYRSMMDVNYFGIVNTTQAFLPYLQKQRGGAICNVSSLLGFMGIFGYTAYAASKHAITGYSDCLRQELLEYNISISVLFPPDTDTPQLHEENKIKPAETKAIAGKVKALTADQVAHCLLKGVSRGKYHLLPGFDSKFTYFMYRHFPWLVHWVIDGPLKKYQKKQARQ
jgi:3-dehydrosphinganine reductase